MNLIKYDVHMFPNQGISSIQSQLLNLFWAGFIIYSLSFLVGTTEILSLSTCQAAQLIGIILFVPSSLALISYRFENDFLKLFFLTNCVWLLIIIGRGLTFDYYFVKKILFDPYSGMFLYFVPFIILFPNDLKHYKKCFKSIIIVSIIYLVLDIYFFNQLISAGDENGKLMLEYFAKTLGLSAGFILLTYPYHNKRYIIISSIAILITLILAVIMGRRGLLFITTIILFFTTLIFIYHNRRHSLSITLIVLIISSALATQFFKIDFKELSILSYTTERLNEDTRSTVELFFYDDMNQTDWIFGRGMSGLVAAPVSLYDDHVPGKPGYRDGIETDYLKIILKGGVISLVLLLLIAIPAIYYGLFRSHNILSKAAAIWVIIWLISLYPSNVTNFTLSYILVWISIGICYSEKIRNMNDIQLKINLIE